MCTPRPRQLPLLPWKLGGLTCVSMLSLSSGSSWSLCTRVPRRQQLPGTTHTFPSRPSRAPNLGDERSRVTEAPGFAPGPGHRLDEADIDLQIPCTPTCTHTVIYSHSYTRSYACLEQTPSYMHNRHWDGRAVTVHHTHAQDHSIRAHLTISVTC